MGLPFLWLKDTVEIAVAWITKIIYNLFIGHMTCWRMKWSTLGKGVDIQCHNHAFLPSCRLTASSEDPGGERVNGLRGEGRGDGVLWVWPVSESAICEDSCLLNCMHEAATRESPAGASRNLKVSHDIVCKLCSNRKFTIITSLCHSTSSCTSQKCKKKKKKKPSDTLM